MTRPVTGLDAGAASPVGILAPWRAARKRQPPCKRLSPIFCFMPSALPLKPRRYPLLEHRFGGLIDAHAHLQGMDKAAL